MKLPILALFALFLSAQTVRVGHVERGDTEYLRNLHQRMIEADELYQNALKEMKEKYKLPEDGEFSDDFTHTAQRVPAIVQ